MRDFPSCFGENGVQVADSASNESKNAQNTVTCIYQAHLRERSCSITISWSRSLMGQGLTIGIDDFSNQSLRKVDIKPWLFSKRKGCKTLGADSTKIDIFWDLSSAKFGSGPEPLEGFYVAVVSDFKMILLLGDLNKEAYRKTNATPPPTDALFITKREHLFGKRVFCTKAQFCDNGQIHDITIECETVSVKDPSLEIKIDWKRVVLVKHLVWKFRGNQTILVDGLPVDVLWDAHSWLFGTPMGNAVFMFQTSLSGEKLLPATCSQIFREIQSQGLGFSFILYAWKNE